MLTNSLKTVPKVLKQIREQFLLNYTPLTESNRTLDCFFRNHFPETSLFLCQFPEKVGAAHQKAPLTPLSTPACASLETCPLLGLAAPAAQPATPGHPPGTEEGAARGDAQPLQCRRHSGEPGRTPARRARSGARGARLARPTRRWPRATFPAQGGGQGRAHPAGRPRSKRSRSGGTLTCERDANSILPTRARASCYHAAAGTWLATDPSPAEHPRPRTQRAAPGAPAGPGEGRTRRPGRGSSPRRPLGAAALGCEATVSDQTFATAELRFARGVSGGSRRARPEAAAGAGAPGSPLQRREGVEPSGRVSRGRNEGAVPPQPPAGTPGYARQIFARFIPGPPLEHMPLLQSVSLLQESILELLQGWFCFIVVKGRGSAASQNNFLLGSLCKTGIPGFLTEASGLGSCKISWKFRQTLLYRQTRRPLDRSRGEKS